MSSKSSTTASAKENAAGENTQKIAPASVLQPKAEEKVSTTQNANQKSSVVAPWSTAAVRVTKQRASPSRTTVQSYPTATLNPSKFSPHSRAPPLAGASVQGMGLTFENHVRRAIRQHRVFSVHPHFPAIRRALISRGWIEKARGFGVTISNPNRASIGVTEISQKGEDETDESWLSRGLRDYPADFVWAFLGDYVNWHTVLPNQTINQHPTSPFTSKVGISSCLQQSHWVSEAGRVCINFPRCYRLGVDEERAAFISDFRLTACLALLKWVVGAFERDTEAGVADTSSRISSVSIDFAVRQITHYVRIRKHEDLDWISPLAVTAQQWESFLEQYYTVVINKGKVSGGEFENNAKHMYQTAVKTLQKVAPFWPQLSSDGVLNVWICKPAARNRGIGIVLMNSLEKILNSSVLARDSNWVVQKYIERPLLIYKTKFDIRQWFIVTNWSPLTVWFYKESYLRFCSKPFTLQELDESIHLCNNAVQVKYKNAENRNSALPEENMWDNYTFLAYLKTIGKAEMWDTVIYPGMKQGVMCVLLSSQEDAVVRKNSFELYGADFMLTEDFQPWLIEINSSPCMAPTTSVTARMCNQCLYDCIKVVIDHRLNSSANTGLFELIYRQTPPAAVNSVSPAVDLTLNGRKLGHDVDWPSVVTKCQSSQGSKKEIPLNPENEPKVTASNSSISSKRLNFQDLLTRLRFEDAQATTPTTTAENLTRGSAVSEPEPSSEGKVETFEPKPSESNKTSKQNPQIPPQKSLCKNVGRTSALEMTQSVQNETDQSGEKDNTRSAEENSDEKYEVRTSHPPPVEPPSSASANNLVSSNQDGGHESTNQISKPSDPVQTAKPLNGNEKSDKIGPDWHATTSHSTSGSTSHPKSALKTAAPAKLSRKLERRMPSKTTGNHNHKTSESAKIIIQKLATNKTEQAQAHGRLPPGNVELASPAQTQADRKTLLKNKGEPESWNANKMRKNLIGNRVPLSKVTLMLPQVALDSAKQRGQIATNNRAIRPSAPITEPPSRTPPTPTGPGENPLQIPHDNNSNSS